MKTLRREFTQICKERYTSLGFINHSSIENNGQTFSRMRSDILQSFALKESQYGSMCTVEFGVMPLCADASCFPPGQYTLDQFTAELSYRCWRYAPESNDSVKHTVKSIISIMDAYLMPFFQACTDCRDAFPKLIQLEELFDRNRKACLASKGIADGAEPLKWRILADPIKYDMALTIHDWAFVRSFLEYQVSFYKIVLEEMRNPNGTRQPEIVKSRFEAGLKKYTGQLERLNSGDTGYFDAIVRDNALKTLAFLKKEHMSLVTGAEL